MPAQPNNTEFDLDAFLSEIEAETPEEKEAAKLLFSKKKNQGLVLRQADYDRKMDASKVDLAKKLAEIDKKQLALDDLTTRNIAYKGEADKAVEKAQKEVDKLRAKAVKAAEQAGYTLDEIESDEVITPRKAELDVDELARQLGQRYVSPEMLDRLATGHINLTLELDEIKDQYAELYPNKRLTKTQKEELLKEYNEDVAKHLKSHPQSSPPPLMDTASRLYDFGTVRNKMEDARIQKLLDDARADERAKLTKEMSDQGLPAPRRGGPVSPIAFKSLKDGEKPSQDRRVRMAMEELENRRRGAAAS